MYIVLLALFAFCSDVSPYRILVVFPHIGKSHFDAFDPLFEALANRGHDVTVLSFFPKENPVPNYRDISLHGLTDIMVNSLPVSSLVDMNPVSDFCAISQIGLETCEAVLSSDQVKNIVESNITYDLIVTELFNTDCFLGIVDKLKSPFIALSSSSLFPTTDARFGNPDNPAYVSNMFLPYTDEMSFTERLRNCLTSLVMYFYRHYYYEEAANEIAMKYLGNDLRSIREVGRETGLVLTNRHFSISRPRPLQPSIIEVGGLHIKPPKPLPKDIETFINESDDGVIYFSMGSVLLSTSFPEEKRRAFLHVFSQLRQRVLWKYEDESVEGKSDNVMVSRWLPQRDILAHEKVRLFITHGGLLSISEAVYCGVPILGIPMFGDQATNVMSVKASGAAILLPYNELDASTLLSSITTILNDKRFKADAEELSRVFIDRPTTPLETAVFWTEYAARHKGVRHMKSAAAQLSWWQICLLDVIFLPTIIFFVLAVIIHLAAIEISSHLARLVAKRNSMRFKRD